jgi:hypothetical protein
MMERRAMSTDPEARVGLTAALFNLRTRPELGADPRALAAWPYRRVVIAAVDGKLPAELVGGRWKVRVADLPKLAQMMGATPRPRMGRPPKAKRASGPSSMEAVA